MKRQRPRRSKTQVVHRPFPFAPLYNRLAQAPEKTLKLSMHYSPKRQYKLLGLSKDFPKITPLPQVPKKANTISLIASRNRLARSDSSQTDVQLNEIEQQLRQIVRVTERMLRDVRLTRNKFFAGRGRTVVRRNSEIKQRNVRFEDQLEWVGLT